MESLVELLVCDNVCEPPCLILVLSADFPERISFHPNVAFLSSIVTT